MYNVIGRPAWLPSVKFDSCNNLLSSVHTDWFCVLSILIIKTKILLVLFCLSLFVCLSMSVSVCVSFCLSFCQSVFVFHSLSIFISNANARNQLHNNELLFHICFLDDAEDSSEGPGQVVQHDCSWHGKESGGVEEVLGKGEDRRGTG